MSQFLEKWLQIYDHSEVQKCFPFGPHTAHKKFTFGPHSSHLHFMTLWADTSVANVQTDFEPKFPNRCDRQRIEPRRLEWLVSNVSIAAE